MARPPRRPGRDRIYGALRDRRRVLHSEDIVAYFAQADHDRVESMATGITEYLRTNVPAAFERRRGLPDYRANPYALMTSASLMDLRNPRDFADFLFNNKLYMALETSFGKSFEAVVGQYPIASRHKWETPPEKRAEAEALGGLGREQRTRLRTGTVWREIDRSVVIGTRRYLASIKMGPNTINDSMVAAMADAIRDNHRRWAQETRQRYPRVRELDVVIGLTYGTDRSTNNKENQVLVRLLEGGFQEEDRAARPGVLIDGATRSTRVYRMIGADFWAFIGNPAAPGGAGFVFLEILLALARALASGIAAELEDRINSRIRDLATTLRRLQFPRGGLPAWVREDFTDAQLFWFAGALTAFYDEGV